MDTIISSCGWVLFALLTVAFVWGCGYLGFRLSTRFVTERKHFDNISIAVIRSVAEIAQEGEVMHHCVFDAEYYRKSDSLILSARDRNGSRLETIEVNLRTFKVVQSRAKFNKTSDFHAEILSLMQQNMHLIRRTKPTA